eukprot:TRINITY_DN15529_c0_g3_i2.p2 TRINITY_DN15529_c0_g3~~TRINITY_DN15529_c0_g3_i2.p2  ORF type:complete len:182 (+),score=45.32 TRINITY_DN15529_c0_g3_i2:210-755(+)
MQHLKLGHPWPQQEMQRWLGFPEVREDCGGWYTKVSFLKEYGEEGEARWEGAAPLVSISTALEAVVIPVTHVSADPAPHPDFLQLAAKCINGEGYKQRMRDGPPVRPESPPRRGLSSWATSPAGSEKKVMRIRPGGVTMTPDQAAALAHHLREALAIVNAITAAQQPGGADELTSSERASE